MIDAARIIASLGGLALLAYAALAPADASPDGRSWAMTAGFGLLAAACIAGRRRLHAAGLVAACMTALGGLSALAAVRDLRTVALADDRLAGPFVSLGLSAVRRVQGVDAGALEPFREAAAATVVAGLCAIAAAAAGQLALRRRSGPALAVSLHDAERLGRAFVALATVGLVLALARFAVIGDRQADPFAAIKSFWTGGSYLVLIAHLAIPGFTLWIMALLAQGAPRREWIRPAIGAGLFLAALVPTGQRTFIVEAGVAAALGALVLGRLSARRLALGLLAAVVGLMLSQAIRNEIRETGRITASDTISRLAPDRLPDLFASQVASFRWTYEVARYRDELEIPRPLVALAAKPIPRQLYPDKPEGFSERFTAQMHPDAAADQVGFATPLVAESGFDLGLAGVVIAHLLLGAALGLGAALVAGRAPAVLVPACAMAVGWTGLVFLRGDVANAAFAASTWVIPAAAFAVLLHTRARAPIRRLVIDGLQVPAEFSGVGRQLMAVGHALARDPLHRVEVVLRCPENVAADLRPAFADDVKLETPIPSNRPRYRRIVHQQLWEPLRHGRSTLVLAAGDQAPLWGRCRVVLIAHDVRRLTDSRTSRRAERWYYRLVQPASLRRADAILTVSEFSRGQIEAVARPRRPVVVVAQHPPPVVDAPAPAPAGGPIVVTGALRSYKGTEDVIEAVGLVDEQLVPEVVFAGSDEGRREELEALAEEHGVAHRVRLAGWMPEPELEALLASAMATLNPSHHEGYGLPVAESLARGIPTLASSIPPQVEVAGDAALWFEPGDVKALAATLARVGADAELRADLAGRALERSRELASAGPTWADAIASALRAAEPAPAPAQPALTAATR